MLNPAEKAYCLALQALKERQYSRAAGYFERAAAYFETNQEFNLLRETTRLLVALKKELAAAETDDDALIIQEVFSDGEKTVFSEQESEEERGYPLPGM